MSYLHFDFPHTRNQDSDLRQIVEMYDGLKNLPTEFSQLRNYVNSYFNSLDINSEISEELENMYADGRLRELIAQSNYVKFTNKHICIIGDSISDNSTNPPNWTTYFTSEVEKVGARVTNISKNGSSFAGWANNQENVLAEIPIADIYIVFLGINDFQGQFPWTGTIAEFCVPECAKYLFRRIINMNTNAEYYYISPIKILRTEVQKYSKPLVYYRSLYENIATTMGFTVISGYNAPQLSAYNPTKLSDTLHPSTDYAPVLSAYILNSMISGASSFSAYENLYFNTVYTPTIGNGYTELMFDSNFNVSADINIVGAELSIGWNTICNLNDALTTFVARKEICVYNPLNDKHYQVQISNNKLEIYSMFDEITALRFIVNWTNRWNGKIINE